MKHGLQRRSSSTNPQTNLPVASPSPSCRRWLALCVLAVLLVNPGLALGQGVSEEAQAAALAALGESSETEVQARFDDGVPRFLSFLVPADGKLAGDLVAQSLTFLTENSDLYRIASPAETLHLQRVAHGPHHTSVVFGQHWNGLAVDAASLVVHLDGSWIYATNGSWLPDFGGLPAPILTSLQAEKLAIDESIKNKRSAMVIGGTRLVYFDAALFARQRSLGEDTRLAYRVAVEELATEEEATAVKVLLIDAHGGQVLRTRESLYEAKDFDIETALGTSSDKDDWFDERGSLPDYNAAQDADLDGANTFAFSHTIYDYFFSRFNWPSYDGCDDQLEITVDFAMPNSSPNAAAFYRPSSEVIFVAGGAASLSVIGHEFVHGVVEHSADLEYEWQSGGLNESYADIFGAIITANGASWPGVNRGFRHTSQMPLAPSIIECNATKPFFNDCGFVHSIDSIPNNAAVLLMSGGTLNSVTVAPVAVAKVEQLLFHVLTQWLHDCSDFQEMRDSMVAAARQRNDFSATEVCSVINAYAAVGLGRLDTNCDGIEDGGLVPRDRDNDGSPDSSDNCFNRANPSQQDTDNDGQGDACDTDDDNDGVLDGPDNCQFIANPGQADSDSDGRGDLCDDEDGDGILDVDDNCPFVPNFDQSDDDSDGIGNVCDNDHDNDGIPNDFDACPEDEFASQQNSDTDRWGDDCDNCRFDDNFNQLDIDDDGLGDVCDDDMDGDGIANDDDNCERVPNPDQFDGDKNGVGLVCDPGEWRTLYGMSMREYMRGGFLLDDRLQTIRIPILPCALDCPDWFNERTMIDLGVELPFETTVRVVDDRGFVVTKGDLGWDAVLRFAIDGDSRYQAPESVAGGGASVFEGTRYFLEIDRPADVEGGQYVLGLSARRAPFDPDSTP